MSFVCLGLEHVARWAHPPEGPGAGRAAPRDCGGGNEEGGATKIPGPDRPRSYGWPKKGRQQKKPRLPRRRPRPGAEVLLGKRPSNPEPRPKKRPRMKNKSSHVSDKYGFLLY